MRIKSRFTTRELVLLALFSAVWAAIEINLGFVLKIFRIPFSGTLLNFFGLLILFIARTSVPKRSTALLMGFTTALLKFIYLGGIAIYPVLGILIEVVLVEIALYKDQPEKINYLLAGALSLLWSFFHPFFAQGILAGWGLVKVYVLIVQRGASFLGIQEHQALLIFSVLILFHLILGVFVGLLSWKLTRIVFKRLPNYQMFEA